VIYDHALSGTVLWVEDRSVMTQDGLFSLTLGEWNPIDYSVFDGNDYRWLEITVLGTPGNIPMSPRTRLASVPYAARSTEWTTAGGDVYRAGGRVGIGTSTPTHRLHIAGLALGDGINLAGSSPGYTLQPGGGAAFGEASTSGLWSQSADSGDAVVRSRAGRRLHLQSGFGSSALIIGSSGYVTMNAGATVLNGFDTYGNMFAHGSMTALSGMTVYGSIFSNTGCQVVWSCPSDRRLKKNIEPFQHSLDEVHGLSVVSFDWREDEFPDREFPEGKQIGLIAQEVQKVMPEAVQENRDGYLSVDYSRLVPLLVGSIKEQQKMIEDQQNRIDALEKKLDLQTP
jgi:hypothetical protein